MTEEKYIMEKFKVANDALSAIYNAWLSGLSETDAARVYKKLDTGHKIVTHMELVNSHEHSLTFVLSGDDTEIILEINGKGAVS